MWQTVSLGDVCTISSSKRIFAKEYQTEGIPFYRGKEVIEKHNGNSVSTELFISIERYEEIKSKFPVPKKGDILLTSVGTLGVPWLVDEEKFYFKDGNLTWLRCNAEILSEYLYLWLNAAEAQNQIDAKCIGSTQKALTIETLNKFQITLPSLEVQEKIVSAVKPIESRINNNRKINENLEQQAQAIYHHMFIGNTSSEWKEGSLSDIADITMGQSPSGSSYNEDGEGTIFFQGRAEFGFRFPSIRLYTTETKRMACANDVLMSVRAPVGDLNVAHTDCCIGRGLAAIHSKTGQQSFVLYTMFALKEQLNVFNGEGTVFGSINRNSLNDMPIVIPSLDSISAFEDIVAPIDAAIRNNYDEICRLIQLRDSLLPKLMSGEIDVSNLEI